MVVIWSKSINLLLESMDPSSLLNVLKALDLNVDDVREQGCDNGSNIKGKRQGYQKRFLEINPKTLYMLCLS
jgi:hypothetical protein